MSVNCEEEIGVRQRAATLTAKANDLISYVSLADFMRPIFMNTMHFVWRETSKKWTL